MSDHSKTSKTPLADDLIWGIRGADGIAAAIGISPSRAYYLAAKGMLPVKKLGHRTVFARRSELQKYLVSNPVPNDNAA